MKSPRTTGGWLLAISLVLAGTALFAWAGRVTGWGTLSFVILATCCLVAAYLSLDSQRRFTNRQTAVLADAGVLAGVLLTAVPLIQPNEPDETAEDKPPKDPLVVRVSWPNFPDCDGATRVAMREGGPDLADLDLSGQDYRASVARQGGSAFGSGWLTIRLSARRDTVAQVTSIEPTIFEHDTQRAAWSIETEGGCGGSVLRLFDWQLDAPGPSRLVDKGVYSDAGDGADLSASTLLAAGINSAPLGSSFTVSQMDTTVITVHVQACEAGYWEWGLLMRYVVDGKDYSQMVGTPDKPFQTLAGKARDTYALGYIDGRVAPELTRSLESPQESSCF